MHCCLTPWLEEEASSVYWAVHTEGDPWREYLIVVWLEEDLLHTHALLFDLLARFATRLLSCSITYLRLSEEEPLCAFLTSVCSVICLRLSKEESLWESLLVSAPLLASGCPKRNRCANPLTSVCSVTHLWLSEEESLCESLTSVCLITYLCLPKRNRCVNFLRSLTKKRVGSACAF